MKIREKKHIIPHTKNGSVLPFIRDRKPLPDKELADQPIRLEKKAAQDKLILERRPPGFILKEIDSAILQKKKPSRRQSGSHSLSELCHFKGHQK